MITDIALHLVIVNKHIRRRQKLVSQGQRPYRLHYIFFADFAFRSSFSGRHYPSIFRRVVLTTPKSDRVYS